MQNAGASALRSNSDSVPSIGGLGLESRNNSGNTADEIAALEAIMRPAFDKAFSGDDPDSQKMVELIKKLEN